MKTHLLFFALTSAVSSPILSQAQSVSATADKTQYTLLNPTPRELMREMSTDRPDKTESAYTVDAGHFQVEMDVANWSYDRYGDTPNTRVESLSIATANLKIGLCNSSDLQLVVPTYNWVREKDLSTGSVQRNSGFGDLVARLKMNFWGNDGGSTAFAAMPFVKIPSNQDGLGNKAWEGGIIFPLAVELPAGWGMGVMTEFDFNEDGSSSGYHPEFVNSITFSHNIVGNFVDCFHESIAPRDADEWIEVISRTGHADVDTCIQQQIVGDCITETGIHSTNPFRS